MLRETSCGVIPFRRREGKIEYLLLHSAMVRNPEATWEFPKGSIERGESELVAAFRELREETALRRIKILPDFRDQVEYIYRRDGYEIEKRVIFFVAEVSDWRMPKEAPTREHGPHPETGEWHAWAEEAATSQRLFHPGMRDLLRRVAFFIHEYDRIRRSGRAAARYRFQH
ncbi:NUDIX domain-containing protein [Myxococcota bacterium]|nr:NUDIX domain-containing protein [Myxococcota bacterium]MBU1897154.1 NUDIX domain-containing protein [Myxococcota bacterium]